MPKVRTLQSGVQTAPIPNTRRGNLPIGQVDTPEIRFNPSPQQYGSQLGDTLQRGASLLLDDLNRKKAEERAKQDQIAVMEADRKLSEWENRFLYDPKQGALTTRRGKESFALPDETLDAFDKVYDELIGTLSTEEQKFMLQRQAATRRKDIDSSVLRHVAVEMQKFDDSETQSYLANSQQSAMANATDPVRVQTEIERQRIAVVEYADRHGMGAEYIKQKLSTELTKTHLGVIEGLLAQGLDLQASAYAKEHREEISGDKRADVDKVLAEGSLTGESQRRADAILKSQPDMESAIEETRKIKEPKLRDLTEARVKSDWVLKRQIENDRRQVAQAQAKDLLDQNMKQMLNLLDQKKPVFARDVIPPNVWNQLDETDRGHLETYAKRYQQDSATGGIKTNQSVWYARMREASSAPEKFAARNLMGDLSNLSPSDFQELAKVQRSILEGKTKDVDKVLDDFRTESQIMSDALRLAGIDPGAKENADSVARLHKMVGEQAAILQRQTAKKATNADIQALVDDALAKTVTAAGWFGRYETPLLELKANQIPGAERRKVEAALRDAGKPVNDQTVLDLYLRTQQRLQKK